MQNKNLNNQGVFDDNQEELMDISSVDTGFDEPNNYYNEITEEEQTDINKINSNSIPIDIDIVEDIDENFQDKTKRKTRYYKPEKSENFFIKHKIPVIITSAAVVAVTAVGVLLWQLFANDIIHNPFEETVGPIVNEEGEFTFLSDIQISGIDISNKTYEDAKKLLENNQSKFIKDFTVSVKANEKSYEFTPEDFTYTYNIEEVLNQAKKYCEDVHKGVVDATQPATDSNGKIKDMYTVKATVVDKSIEAVALKVAKDNDVDAENAHVSKFTPYSENRFEYKDGKTGFKTDKKNLADSIKKFINSGEETGVISAKVDVIKPEITKEMVKKNIVPLSYYTTTSVNTENATLNMGTALEACNGSVIEPGETWSFNECTGDSNLESNGYLPAGVISDGSMTQGIGGGLCQASSTIYNTAVFANMEIVERHMHYWASVYVPAGFDATIDYPGLDLKLKNITDYQMFMECSIDGRKLSCTIYGYQDPSYDDIATYSENYNINSGESYDTRSYRILYKNGEEVSREELPGSHYSLSEGHYVQYSDDGTHRQKPDGTVTGKNKPVKNNENVSQGNTNVDNSSSKSSVVSSSISSSSSSSKTPSSSSSSKTPSSETSSTDSTSSSPSTTSSQTHPSTEPEPETTPTETEAGNEDAE